jgi:hypothetical protein
MNSKYYRGISILVLVVFTLASCSHHWTPITSDEIQPREIDLESLVDKKVRFHMADGSTEEFTVTVIEEPLVRGYVLERAVRKRPERSPREIDLRDVVAIELETVNTQRTVRTYYLVGLGVLVLAGALLVALFSQLE